MVIFLLILLLFHFSKYQNYLIFSFYSRENPNREYRGILVKTWAEINTVDLLPSASLGAELTNLPDTLIFALVGRRQEMGTGINDFHV